MFRLHWYTAQARFYTRWQKIFHHITEPVNSFHNFGVKKPIDSSWQPLAHAGEIIEAAIHTKFNILAVQWHPEREPVNHSINKFIWAWLKGVITK